MDFRKTVKDGSAPFIWDWGVSPCERPEILRRDRALVCTTGMGTSCQILLSGSVRKLS